MPTLALHFPWGRYHATPWGRYVNEGAVELPPSPWRLLRTLYSVWRLRAPDLDEDVVHRLLGKLAEPPNYLLPPYQVAHTRHYFPDSKHRSGKPSTDLGLDAFATLGGDATIYAIWPFDLDPDEAKALDRLAGSLPYLGRADAICDARVEPDRPLHVGGDRLAVPLDLELDVEPDLKSGLEAELPDGRLRTDLLAPCLPLDVAALTRRPVDVRAEKLLYPPCTRLIPYAVPGPEASRPSKRRRSRSVSGGPVTAVRLSVTGTPQPRATETVTVADTLRATCVSMLNDLREHTPGRSLLVGKDADGAPLEGHEHAHFLALNDGRAITELAVWAPGGLSPDELEALGRLAGRTVGVPNGVPGSRDLHVRVIAHGGPELLPESLRGPARAWVSHTPFVPTRYRPRRTGDDEYLRMEVERELTRRNYPSPTNVTMLRRRDWALYTRHRWSPHRRPGESTKRVGSRTENRPVFGVRIEFADPRSGPLALGTLSHFGLGLFQAEV